MTRETKHTPGPWTVAVEDKWPFHLAVRGADGATVLNMTRWGYSSKSQTVEDVRNGVGFDPDARPEAVARNAQQEQDARLIAAAPELLAELRNFVNGVETGMIDSPADEILANVTRRARAALSKATGEGE